MKKLSIIFALLLMPFMVCQGADALNIVQVEYYIDTDPGYGKGTDVLPAGTEGSDIRFDFTADLSSITPGFHILYIRAKDENDQWTLTYTRPLLKIPAVTPPDIVKAEYFMDEDPGYGSGTDIPITAGSDVAQSFVADLSGASEGFHVLYIRVKDQNGVWSLTDSRPFFRSEAISDTVPEIIKAEYFLDEDPGYGSGTDIPITAGSDVAQSFVADLSGASEGFHVLYIRVKDENGGWSLTSTRPFFKTETAHNITQIEYFLDEEPGFGNAVGVSITPGTEVAEDFIADLTGAALGSHTLYVRARDANGLWTSQTAIPFSAESYSLADVIILLNILAQNTPEWWTASHLTLADKVADGVIDTRDVISIIQYLSGS